MDPITPDQPDDLKSSAQGPRMLQKMEGALLALSIVCILGMGGMITLNIITRYMFNWSIPDAIIIVRELMIGSVILPLAYVTAERAHIMVEVFTSYMSDKSQLWLNLLTSVIGATTLIPILYGGYLDLTGVLEEGAYFFGDLELPEWPGRLAFFIGYVFFVIRLLYLIGHDYAVLNRSINNNTSPN